MGFLYRCSCSQISNPPLLNPIDIHIQKFKNPSLRHKKQILFYKIKNTWLFFLSGVTSLTSKVQLPFVFVNYWGTASTNPIAKYQSNHQFRQRSFWERLCGMGYSPALKRSPHRHLNHKRKKEPYSTKKSGGHCLIHVSSHHHQRDRMTPCTSCGATGEGHSVLMGYSRIF